MGNDGGTIAKRKDLVKTERITKDDLVDKDSSKWELCAISQTPLKDPIVSDYLGNVFNKESIIEYLIEKKASVGSQSEKFRFDHLSSIKDLKTLNTSWKYGALVCPVTKVELSSKNQKFLYLIDCGCILSFKLIHELMESNDFSCPNCSVTYDPDHDIVFLNPSKEDLLKNLNRYEWIRNAKLYHTKLPRKDKKRKIHEDKTQKSLKKKKSAPLE